MLIILITFNEFHLLVIFNWYLKISKVNKKRKKERKKNRAKSRSGIKKSASRFKTWFIIACPLRKEEIQRWVSPRGNDYGHFTRYILHAAPNNPINLRTSMSPCVRCLKSTRASLLFYGCKRNLNLILHNIERGECEKSEERGLSRVLVLAQCSIVKQHYLSIRNTYAGSVTLCIR